MISKRACMHTSPAAMAGPVRNIFACASRRLWTFPKPELSIKIPSIQGYTCKTNAYDLLTLIKIQLSGIFNFNFFKNIFPHLVNVPGMAQAFSPPDLIKAPLDNAYGNMQVCFQPSHDLI